MGEIEFLLDLMVNMDLYTVIVKTENLGNLI